VTDPEKGNSDFPSDYAERVERVCRESAEEFRSCRGDLLKQLRVCCSYFERGEAEGISHGELIDFLGISARSVFTRAGYSDSEGLRVMEALPLITFDANGRPQAPTSLPNKAPPPESTQSKFKF
jgi:hypothetical protein